MIDVETPTLIHEKEAIMAKMEAQMERCPKCKTIQPLNDIWIQKKGWGGTYSDENLSKLCSPCNADHVLFIQSEDKLDNLLTLEDFRNEFQKFLKAPQKEMTTAEKSLKILKELAGLRVQIALEASRFEGRFRSRSQRLDEIYPVQQSVFGKLLNELFGKKAQEAGWQKFLMSQVAEVKTIKAGLEKEIKKQLSYYPIWTEYAKHIPGIGPWTVGYLIAVIGDPRNFKKTSNLWGHAGLRVDEKGFAQSRTREKLNYNPTLKTMIVNIIPSSFQYKKNQHPDSPYSKLLLSVEAKESKKALNANPRKCRIKGCNVGNIVNLGFKTVYYHCCEQGHSFKSYDPNPAKCSKKGCKITEIKQISSEEIFQGYCCDKTFKAKKKHKFFNPDHRNKRVMREVGKKFLSDFYHTWLYFMGENADVSRNERIMWVFEQALKED